LSKYENILANLKKIWAKIIKIWENLIRFGQNQNLAFPKTFELLRLCWQGKRTNQFSAVLVVIRLLSIASWAVSRHAQCKAGAGFSSINWFEM